MPAASFLEMAKRSLRGQKCLWYWRKEVPDHPHHPAMWYSIALEPQKQYLSIVKARFTTFHEPMQDSLRRLSHRRFSSACVVSNSILLERMDSLLWAVRSLHLFSVVVWFGGIMYQAVVTLPVANVEHSEFDRLTLHLLRRFLPFVWMCMWTILLTGVCLMLFNPKFVFLEFRDRWSIVLAMKQLTFILMTFFTFGYARMFARVEEILAKPESDQLDKSSTSQESERPVNDVMVYYRRMLEFGRISVALAIVAILLAASM